MSDVMRLTSDTQDLDARLNHERDLAQFRDDNGHLILVPGKDGYTLAIRPGSELAKIVQRIQSTRTN
jgi:hypothetical protein